ncbi:SNARE complex subunit (Tlg2), putative [Talaromyces stipitatus ATCC 10500]|uniref:SNARE complex subunit (Tlg2), putative n=1 Tax=Talaromyces stipitatus (strain ATCC 10500 / CBS 375.48 / QM 6759 / NRRL 1006) TaxID=441959 RepID=B8MKU7_TALSN|nr:SNARE complex subunit (Tlg2), putative [Talaromyces stipitatus ATCC 10500]EED14946.1 SNARE complex subunit (Tlg2), putative [Talaromyces stipitatus ATCC 10500]
MWRDRTNLYISYRQSFAHHPTKKPRYFGPSQGFSDTTLLSEERRGLIAGAADGLEDDGDAVIEMDLLPPRWVDVQEEVTETLADIAQKSARLDKLHQKHILPSFGDEGARKEEETIIEQYTQEITRGFHSCQKAIQRIDALVREQKQLGSVTKGDETMAKNIQISLAARVQEASARFRKKQSTYLRKLRELEGMVSPFERVSTPIQSQYSDPSLMESDADKSFSQSTLQQTSQKQQQQLTVSGANDVAIAQREREINDIAKGIIELSDIFRELQTMIIDQGTMLDRIDYNVERMATDVKQADTELKVASNYQRKTTKRKIILLLILIMIGMIVLLALKPKRHNNNSNIPDTTTPPQEDVQNDQQIPPRLSRRIARSLEDGADDDIFGARHLYWQRDNRNNYHEFDSLFSSGLLI